MSDPLLDEPTASIAPGAAPVTETKPQIEVIDQRPIKLDLACGNTPAAGFRAVDEFAEGADRVNLLEFPWPWANDCVDELRCSHFMEHIPMIFVHENGSLTPVPKQGAVDMLMRFMAEAWRVLKMGGKFEIVVPALRSNRAFQDPTHRRFICEDTFFYFNEQWRKMNGLDHYLAGNHKIHFLHIDQGSPQRIPYSTEEIFSPEVIQKRAHQYWNSCADLRAILVKSAWPPPSPEPLPAPPLPPAPPLTAKS